MQIFFLLLRVAPAYERVIDERVLDIDEDADRSINARQFFDADDGREKRSARAAILFGRLDAHQPEVETLAYQRRVELSLLVHLFDAGAQFAFGKLAHACSEHLLVFREHRQRTPRHLVNRRLVHYLPRLLLAVGNFEHSIIIKAEVKRQKLKGIRMKARIN